MQWAGRPAACTAIHSNCADYQPTGERHIGERLTGLTDKPATRSAPCSNCADNHQVQPCKTDFHTQGRQFEPSWENCFNALDYSILFAFELGPSPRWLFYSSARTAILNRRSCIEVDWLLGSIKGSKYKAWSCNVFHFTIFTLMSVRVKVSYFVLSRRSLWCLWLATFNKSFDLDMLPASSCNHFVCVGSDGLWNVKMSFSLQIGDLLLLLSRTVREIIRINNQ